MVNRNQIETILKINGASPSSPDEVIRSVLLSARYNKDEVDTAIMVLRENTRTSKTSVEGLHKVFRSSEALRPNEISQLLGIDVEIDDSIKPQGKSRKVSTLQFFGVWILSVVLATVGSVLYMYLSNIGPFHPGVAHT